MKVKEWYRAKRAELTLLGLLFILMGLMTIAIGQTTQIQHNWTLTEKHLDQLQEQLKDISKRLPTITTEVKAIKYVDMEANISGAAMVTAAPKLSLNDTGLAQAQAIARRYLTMGIRYYQLGQFREATENLRKASVNWPHLDEHDRLLLGKYLAAAEAAAK